MARRITEDLREGYRQLRAGRRRAQVTRAHARARDSSDSGSPVSRDAALRKILLAYRSGPRSVWGPVVLDLWAPAIAERLAVLRPVEPVISQDDIRQQLLAELLQAALVVPLAEDAHHVKARVIREAGRRTARWLAREVRRQALSDPLLEEAAGIDANESAD